MTAGTARSRVLAFGAAVVLASFVANPVDAVPDGRRTPADHGQRNVCARVCTMRDSFACCSVPRERRNERLHNVLRCRTQISANDAKGDPLCVPAGKHDKSAR